MTTTTLPATAPASTITSPTRRRLIAGAATALALPAAAAVASAIDGNTADHPDAEIFRMLRQFYDLEREWKALTLIEDERSGAAEGEHAARRSREKEIEHVTDAWDSAIAMIETVCKIGGGDPATRAVGDALERGRQEAIAKVGPAPATVEEIDERYGVTEISNRVDEMRDRIGDVIDALVKIPAATPEGALAKLRITQFYHPDRKNNPDCVYGYDAILADLDRLLPETKNTGAAA
jgi:hypothetical protein